MISLEQLQLQTYAVLGLTFLLATLAGALFQRSHFCTMGAISDWFIMGETRRAKQWAMAVAVATLGFGFLSWRGAISPLNTIYANPQLSWLSLLLGGFLFGFGMVLGSGCASKSLVRLGGGNLKSLVVLMAMGISAMATLRGLTAVWRVNALDPVSIGSGPGPFLGQWLASVTEWGMPLSSFVAACVVSAAVIFWVFKDRSSMAWPEVFSGACIGVLVVGLWWVSGVMGFVSEHPVTLEPVFLASASGRMESMSLTAPVAYWWDALMYFSDGTKKLSLGMASALGLLLGAWAHASWQGDFRWEGFKQTDDLVLHLLGGALMGVGGVLAMGCTVGQGLSGLSTLSLGSFLAVFGIVAGGVAALSWQLRRAEASV